MKRYFVFFALSFAGAMLCIDTFGFSLQVAGISLAVFAFVALLFIIFKYPKQGVALILGASIAFAYFPLYLRMDAVPLLTDEKVKFAAVAKDYSFDNSQKTGVVCDFKVTSLNGEKSSFAARLFFRDNALKFSPGDVVSGECRLEIPINDESFKSFTYYKTRNIDVIGFCNDTVEVSKSEGFLIRYLPEYISNYVSEKIKLLMPSREAGLVNAILIGDKTDFTIEDQNNFSAAGLAHVVAVSGMHLAFLASFIFMVFGRRKSFIIAIPVLILFTLVVGAPPSVMRALIMQLLVIFSTLLRREADSITSLSVAMVFILICNPYVISDIGFQLSFLATLGLIMYSGRLGAFMSSRIKIKNKLLFRIVNFFVSTLSATLSAILFTTPIIIWNFRSISLIAPISNLLLLWLVTIIFIGAIIGVCVSFVSLSLAKLVMYPISFLSYILILSTDFLANLPFAEIFVDSIFTVIFIIYVYVMLVAFVNSKRKTYLIPLICVGVVLVVTITLNAISGISANGEGIRFSVLDVGQGASMVADYNDTCFVVDCGGSKNAGSITSEYVDKLCDDIDVLILTHMHSDHVNGAKRLIEMTDVKSLYLPEEAPNSELYQSISESAIRRGTEIHFVSDETHLNIDGIECIIYPTGVLKNDENENGLVTIFKKDDFELIVTGDIEEKTEQILCDTYELFDTEVYVVGHHGSDTSSSLALMNRILPELAIISVGEDNYYGHPSKRTLDLFDKMGIHVLRTDINGNVVFYSEDIKKGGN